MHRRCDVGAPSDVKADVPADDDLNALLPTVVGRLVNMLKRRCLQAKEPARPAWQSPMPTGARRTRRPTASGSHHLLH
jgi:hypothetical protein